MEPLRMMAATGRRVLGPSSHPVFRQKRYTVGKIIRFFSKEGKRIMSPVGSAYPPIDWVFLSIGVAFIVAALIFGPRWQTVNPVDFTSEKFGIVKIPFAPFLVLVGVAFAGVGVLFRWEESHLGVAQQRELQDKFNGLSQELERFKSYEMNVQLDFHESVDPSKLHTDLLILKPDKPSPRQVEQGTLLTTPSSNVLLATVPGLGPGDTIYFRATERGSTHPRTWSSEQLRIPVVPLNMNLQ
jgi:hypothetical protein